METWKDPKTDLEWQNDNPDKMPWDKAIEYAKNLEEGWRLPTIEELETLLNCTKCNSVTREEAPFQDSLAYWSSSIDPVYTDCAWYIYFGNGYVDSLNKANHYYVRCVRGKL